MAAAMRARKSHRAGRAGGLCRVEVLVPLSGRQQILAVASRLRTEQRDDRVLGSLLDNALRLYGPRILDNIDLERLPDVRSRVVVAARAMIDRGDARAFAMGRRMLDRAQVLASRDGERKCNEQTGAG